MGWSACRHGGGDRSPHPSPRVSEPGQGALRRVMAQLGGSVPPMDIDEFYEADPRRRVSAELELGSEWLDADGVRHELNYVEDTGELYALREPAPHVSEDPFGGLRTKAPPGYDHKMTVHVIATIATKDDLHRILDGWQEAMGSTDGARWLGDRLREAGVAVGPPGDAIPDDGPDVTQA
jgi:hypothetical protein